MSNTHAYEGINKNIQYMCNQNDKRENHRCLCGREVNACKLSAKLEAQYAVPLGRNQIYGMSQTETPRESGHQTCSLRHLDHLELDVALVKPLDEVRVGKGNTWRVHTTTETGQDKRSLKNRSQTFLFLLLMQVIMETK